MWKIWLANFFGFIFSNALQNVRIRSINALSKVNDVLYVIMIILIQSKIHWMKYHYILLSLRSTANIRIQFLSFYFSFCLLFLLPTQTPDSISSSDAHEKRKKKQKIYFTNVFSTFRTQQNLQCNPKIEIILNNL